MSRLLALRQYILAYVQLQSRPGYTPETTDIVKHIKTLHQCKKWSYHRKYMFVQRTLQRGTLQDRYSDREKSVSTDSTIGSIKSILKKKPTASVRKVYRKLQKKNIKISRGSVHNVMRNHLKFKWKKFKRTQKLTDIHKTKRVTFCKYAIKRYGLRTSNKRFQWHKVINSDFSGVIYTIRSYNAHNSGIWVTDDHNEAERTKGCIKYGKGVMLWGAITAKGLIPRDEPVYFREWLKNECRKIGKPKNTLDNTLYAQFIRNDVKEACERDLDGDLSDWIWQDDTDSKHRTKKVLSDVDTVFENRIDAVRQSPKLADIWPIENIWGAIKEKLGHEEFDSIEELKEQINTIWRSFDENVCGRMMNSIPLRMKACIAKKANKYFDRIGGNINNNFLLWLLIYHWFCVVCN
eukprot:1142962_1